MIMERPIQFTKEYQAVKQLEDALNDMSWKPELFAKATQTMHRTLQQTLFKTIIATLKVYADPKRSVDQRSAASKEGAKQLMETLENIHCPFI